VGLKSVIPLLVGLAVIAAGRSSGQAPSPSMPDGPGKELVQAVCTECHTLERVVAKRATKSEWQDKVLEMLQEDPDITQQERDQIVEYLAKNFPPKVAGQ
jgi:hypothetical protein